MVERKTISESKSRFHKDFPYVIPSIYRKVVDEYLVEINLISNQKEFKQDGIFSYGLLSSFKKFTIGYEPTNHIDKVLEALCNSCDISYVNTIELSSKINSIKSKLNLEEITELLKNNSKEGNQANDLDKLIMKDSYYSRLHSIGIYEFILNNYGSNMSTNQITEKSIMFGKSIGFKEEKIKKDLTQYQNNIKRIEEAIELIKITSKEQKEKKMR
ncbi:photosystem II biogenesis protein Psp29 [Prochlorococcus marinus]|uniref:photosystem II biogenesis protein Psp29 n=1 Tax=Prochlorococcus marinus TaxID=1219 RepID=UPI0022B44A8A|nr:photosystem II biogenesis protein Psp29 [Prochlorococcus marinus]